MKPRAASRSAPAPSSRAQAPASAPAPVTQTAPSNVNVSIRIASPGDDGPVVQVNGAGSDIGAAVNQAVSQLTPASDGRPSGSGGTATAPSGGAELPEDWDWTWTSACFGGNSSGGDRTLSGWNWTWSCGQANAPPGSSGTPLVLPGIGTVPGVSLPVALLPSDIVDAGAAVVAPTRARDSRAGHGSATAPRSDPGGRPPAMRSAAPSLSLLEAAPAVAAGSAIGAAVVRAAAPRSDKPAARAAPPHDAGTGGGPSAPGDEGPAASAGGALGAAVGSILFGLWTAVLLSAIALVFPQVRRRLRPGPERRRPRLRAARLERPG